MTRTGAGTAESPYRAKISGVGTTIAMSPIMYQIVALGSGETAAKKRVRFSGTAYSNDVQKVVVMCNLIIISNGTTYVFGLNEEGKWLRNGVNGLQFTNIDINGKSKKSPIKWEVESSKISDIRLVLANGTEIPQSAWNTVQIEISLFRGIKETTVNWLGSADRYVEYENVTVEHVNEALNFNSREIYYNLENAANSVSAEEVEYLFTDLADASQTAALLDANTTPTNASWVTAHDSTQREMVVHVLRENLAMHSKMQRVFDGQFWGTAKRRQLITLGSETGVWQNTSWVYNYAKQQTGDVRYVQQTLPSAAPTLVLKKEIKLSDGSVQPVIGLEEPTTQPDSTPDSTERNIWNLPNQINLERGINIRTIAGNEGEDRLRFYNEAYSRTGDFFFANNTFKFNAVTSSSTPGSTESLFGLNLANITTNFDLDVEKLRSLNDNKVWIVGGNLSMPVGDAVLGIDAAENIGVNIFGSRVATFTPLGNLGVGIADPLAVIHAHANVSGSADVVLLRATNQNTSYFLSVAVNPNANEVRLYNSGILKVKNTWQFDAVTNFTVSPTTIDATTSSQIPNFGQLQSLAVGYIFATTKPITATTANITLSGLQTVGGVALAASDLVLVKDQTTASENGLYLAASGAWTRSTLHNTDATLRRVVHTISGGTFANFKYVNQNTSTITVGTTNIVYSEFSSNVETDPIWTAYLNTSRTSKTVWAAPNNSNGVASWRNLEPSDINNLAAYASFSSYTTTAALNTLLSAKQNNLSGIGYVTSASGVISYDNRSFVDLTTNQEVGGEKKFLNKTIFQNTGSAVTRIEVYNSGSNTTFEIWNNLRFTSSGASLTYLTLNAGAVTTGVPGIFNSTLQVNGNATFVNTWAQTMTALGLQFSSQSASGNLQAIATDSNGTQAWRTLTISYISGLSTELSNLNSAISGKTTINGTGFVKSVGTTISYDNRTFVDTSTADQVISVKKNFSGGIDTSGVTSSGAISLGAINGRWEYMSGVTSVAGDTSYNLLQGGTDLYWSYLPFHFIASKYVFRRGFVKMAGNTSGANNTNINAPTERLDIEGNFRISGTIKPNNVQGTDGQFYKNAGVGNPDTWATITHADISNLASFTGFDARYYTETEINNLLNNYSLTSHNHTLDGLSNVSISNKLTGDLLRWNGFNWINSSLANAGISAIGHTHTTSDITNLAGYVGFNGYTTTTGLNTLLSGKQNNLSGIGYVTSASGVISYDNRSFVDTSTGQTINGTKRFVNSIMLGESGNEYIRSNADGLEINSFYITLKTTFGGRLYLNGMGCYIGNSAEGYQTPTEALMIGGGIRYATTLKPNNVQNSAGTYLRGNGAGNPDTWSRIVMNDIENLSTGTTGQALIYDGSAPNFMHLRTQTPRLNPYELAVGNLHGILESKSEFTYRQGVLKIANKANELHYVTFGMLLGGTTDASIALRGGGTFHLDAENFRIAKFGGSQIVSRVLTVDLNGYVTATTLDINGGTSQGLQSVLENNNLATDVNLILRSTEGFSQSFLKFQKGSTLQYGFAGYNFQENCLEIGATGSDIKIGVESDKKIYLDETPFSFFYGNAHSNTSWGAGNNQGTPQEGDMMVKMFKSGRWVIRKINVYQNGGRDYLIL